MPQFDDFDISITPEELIPEWIEDEKYNVICIASNE